LIGILLAFWGIDAITAFIPGKIPRAGEINIDFRVLGFTLFISLLTGAIFGLAPAIQTSKIDLNESLKENSRGMIGSLRSNRIRNVLIVSEVALSLVLLIGAALMIRSFNRLLQVDPGFNPNNLLSIELSLPRAKYPKGAERLVFIQDALERIKALPGVESVAATNVLPLSGANDNYAFEIVGRPPDPNGISTSSEYRPITPDYFKAMRLSLLKGRLFDERDTKDTPPVLIINETIAKRYFAGEDPIGKQMKLGFNGHTGEIIGIVKDIRHFSLDSEPREEIYGPYAQTPLWPQLVLVIRSNSNPSHLAEAVRGQIAAIDKNQPVSKIRTVDQIVSDSIAQPRFRSILLGIFGAVALLLASVGIYGVISYSVSQRTHEIGIRMALGAQAGDVMKMVIRQGMNLVLAGVVIGLAASFALTRIISSLLFEVSATDPVTFVFVPFLLAGVALLASYIPARKATKIDPMIALRYE
jgi:putative ABC transport system permease protein